MVPLCRGGSTPCWVKRCQTIQPYNMEGYLPITHTPIWSCEPWPSLMSRCISLEVCYPKASTGKDIIPSAKHMCSFWHQHPHHITCGLHLSSVDALVNVRSRSLSFLLILPGEVLLAGCQVTTIPLYSCGIILSSLPVEVGLHGVGLVHLSHVRWTPTHKGMPTLILVEDTRPSSLVCHFVGWNASHDLMYHLTSTLLPSILNLPLSLKSICLH